MILTIANQKGGAGKSTTAAALAQAAKHRGLTCLAVDLDPQSNLSYFLGADTTRSGAVEALRGGGALDTIQPTPTGIDTISAKWDLQLETAATGRGSARRLKTALSALPTNYDLIIIDTPPTAGELQLCGIMAADTLLIPMQADISNLHGLYQMTETLRHISRDDLSIAGYILTRYDGRTALARHMAETISSSADELHISCVGRVREAIAIREALTMQRDLYEYAPKSNPAIDYMAIFDKLIGG